MTDAPVFRRSWPALASAGALMLIAVPVVAVTACAESATTGGAASQPAADRAASAPAAPAATTASDGTYAILPAVPAGHDVAILAGGCFWCMESDFEPIAGIKAVVSGYIGGHVDRPTYRQVSSRTTGHAEAIWVLYDPNVISYEKLLEEFWTHIDPTTADRQFCDVGDEYRPEIFFMNPAQEKIAKASKEKVTKNKPFAAPIVVAISGATKFFTAESYHQDYYRTTPGRYYQYREGCGRDRRLKELWGDRFTKTVH